MLNSSFFTLPVAGLSQLEPGELMLDDTGAAQPLTLWRLISGALRVDSATLPQSNSFMRLALPGDLVGLESLAGLPGACHMRAITPSQLEPVRLGRESQLSDLLRSAIAQTHQRSEQQATLRSGPVAERVKHLLLLLAQHNRDSERHSATSRALPTLKDMAAIVDSAPETVSRVLSSLRRLDLLHDRERQCASFCPVELSAHRSQPGMTSSVAGPRR